MKRRVKINKLPKGYMQDGGSVSKTLGAVPREFANLEAEKGEVIATEDKGDLALFTIGGKRHSEGGTPMRRPAGDFIWSDTKKMKIKDEDILKEFGASKAATPAKLAKKFLDTNDYRAILDDPKSDDMAKKTAAMMLEKNKEKLARLAFVQEEMKGFPQGIPGIAQDYAASIGVPMAKYGGAMLPKAQFGMFGTNASAAKGYAESLQSRNLPADREVSNSYLDAIAEGEDYSITEDSFTSQGSTFGPPRPSAQETPVSVPQRNILGTPGRSMSESMFGTPGSNFPKYTPVAPGQSFLNTSSQPARPSTSSSNTTSQTSSGSSSTGRTPASSRKYNNIEPYEGGSKSTPTGESNRFNYSEEEFFNDWESVIPGITSMSNADAQAAAYEYILKTNPDQLGGMWNKFGLTEKGLRNEALAAKYPDGRIPADLTEADLKELEDAYVDGFFGARQMRPPTEQPLNLPTKETPQIRETEMDIDPVQEAKRKEAKPFEQDLRNERVLARNRLSERKRYPWRGRLAGRAADPLYQSDVNQQQNLQAQQAIASSAAASFADPNALMSNLSRLSGLTGNQSNKIAAQIQRENTNIGNQFERFNTQLAAQTDVRNLANAQDLYDNTIKTDEVFDEKMRRYNLMQTAARNMTDTNLARINAENQMNPYWTINTGEGPQFGNFEWQSDAARAKYRGQLNSPDAAAKAYQQYLDMDARIMEMGLSKEEEDKLRSDNFRKYEGFTKSKTAAPSQAYNQYIPWTQPSFMGGSQTTYQKYGGSTAKRKKKK